MSLNVGHGPKCGTRNWHDEQYFEKCLLLDQQFEKGSILSIYTLEFIPGVDNDIADSFSRLCRNNMIDSWQYA